MPEQPRHLANKCEDVVNLQGSSAVEQVFDILSVSPSLSVLSCLFECNMGTIICQIIQHLNSPSLMLVYL